MALRNSVFLSLLALVCGALGGCHDERFPRLTPLSYDASHPIRISSDGTQLVTATGSMVHHLDVSPLNRGGKSGGKSGGGSATTYYRLEVADVAISDDGAWIAAGGYRRIHVSGGTLHTPGGGLSSGGTVQDLEPDGMIWSLAFSPDRRWLACSVGLYDTSTWTLVFRFSPAVGAPASPLSTPLPSASAAATPPPVPKAPGAPAWLFHSSEQVQLVRFSPDGQTLIVIGVDKVVLLDPVSQSIKAQHAFKPASSFRPRVDLSPTGLLAIAGQGDGQVRLFEISPKALLPRPALDFDEQVAALAFDAKGDRLAVAGSTRLAIYRPGQGGKPAVRSTGEENPEIVNLAWHPSGTALFASRTDNAIELHEMR